MSTIDEIIFPVFLFIIYFFCAIRFFSPVLEQQANPIEEIIQLESSTDNLQAAVISRDWLYTQSLANLKAFAAELCITPLGDKRSKLTWINAISSTNPKNTVLPLNLCYA